MNLEERGLGAHFGGDTTTEDFGKILRGQEVSNIIVESAISTDAADPVLDELGIGFLVRISFRIDEEDIFDKFLHFFIAWGDSKFDTGLANIDPIGDEAFWLGKRRLEVAGHDANQKRGCLRELAFDEGVTEVMACKQLGVPRDFEGIWEETGQLH